MAIHLITGIPGHGKTLHMVRTLIEEIIPAAKKAGRIVYHNISGFLPGDENVIAVDAEFFLQWADEDGPRNAIIVIDECQFIFPIRGPTARTPVHVEMLTVHRHRGLDFYLITQNAMLIDRFLLPLIETHTDVYRPYGLKFSRVTRMPYFSATTKPRSTYKMGVTTRLRFKPEYFRLYRSSSMHTMQSAVPWKTVLTLGALVASLPIAALVVWQIMAPPEVDVPDAPVSIASCPQRAVVAAGSFTDVANPDHTPLTIVTGYDRMCA